MNCFFLFFHRQRRRRLRENSIHRKNTDHDMHDVNGQQQSQDRPPREDHVDLQGWYGTDEFNDAAGNKHRREGGVAGHEKHFQHIGIQNTAL